MKCMFCRCELTHTFVDLGAAPPSNAYLKPTDLEKPEAYYPLKVMVCDTCWLVQVEDVAGRGTHFHEDYAYFSSFSKSLLTYSEAYVDMITAKLGLGADSQVVEIASNDGYLLQYFGKHGVPCYGIEPTASTAAAAREKGIEVVGEFMGEALGTKLAGEGRKADLIIGNNVLAHVPDMPDFVRGIVALLKDTGTVTVEFQYLLNLIGQSQFDIVYHEHYTYPSLHAVKAIFEYCGLVVYDAEEVTTQGGSLRVYARHEANEAIAVSARVADQLMKEEMAGLTKVETYTSFQAKADKITADFVKFLISKELEGKVVVGYGAAAKGNTMLNYGGVKPFLMKAVADASPSKQGRYMPGSRIPIVSPDTLMAMKPDVVVILPWNIKDEVAAQLADVRSWGGTFAVAVPHIQEF